MEMRPGKNKTQNRSKAVRIEDNELSISFVATENPTCSLKEISEETEISERSVQRILKQNHLHGDHIQLHQKLSETEYEKRAQFSNWA